MQEACKRLQAFFVFLTIIQSSIVCDKDTKQKRRKA